MQEGVAPGPSDADLVTRASAGDRAAFAAMYDRYGDRLHDFCWSMLRNRDDAADATQDTFLRAVERMGQLKDPSKLRPWLYAIARHEALARLKARGRQVPDDALPDLADSGKGPDAAASQNELRDLVWDAAAGLSDRDRVLLDLHVRQGLEGAELAEAAGVGADHAYVLLSRLRSQVERSLGALLVARLGRDDCADLNVILSGWDGRFSALIRKRVARHVDNCDVCGERRRTAASPMALLSAVPVMLAPPELRDVVLAAFVAPASDDGTDGSEGGTSSGGAGKIFSEVRRRPARSALLATSVAAVAGGVVAAITLLGGADDVPAVAATDEPVAVTTSSPATGPAASPETTAPPPPGTTDEPAVEEMPPTDGEPPAERREERASTDDAEPPPEAAPGELAVTTTALDLGAEVMERVVQVQNTGASPLTYQVATSATWLSIDHDGGELAAGDRRDLRVSVGRDGLAEGDHHGAVRVTSPDGAASIEVVMAVERPPVIDGLSAAPERVGITTCPPDTARISAGVTDESGVDSVALSWQGPDGDGAAAMTLRSGTWYAALGPFETPGQVTWHVVAADSRGNTTTSEPRTLTVNPCPQ